MVRAWQRAFTAFVALAVLTALAACSGGKGVAAMKAYELGEYDRAQDLFAKAYQNEKNKYEKGRYSFYLGECYRHKNLYKKAAAAYNKAVRSSYQNDNALLYMGDCLRASGDYTGAAEAYAKYLVKSEHNLTAKRGMESCRMLEAAAADIAAYNYREAPDTGYVVQLARQFNSKYSDYSPAYVGDDYDVVYFTSMRVVKRRKKLNRITGQGNSNIYMTRLDGKGVWTLPEALEEPFSRQIDDGTPSITSDGKTMYFTRCPYDPTLLNSAECYEIVRSGGRWGDPVRVVPGDDSLMMVAHPAISPDGQTLYFVSDKEGGIGGKDIYKSEKLDNGWSEAVNLGAMINTKGDEMFPYVRDDGTLFFSSTGHVGLGGLDIFMATKTETGRYEVRNMGFPINSPGDDFGIIYRGVRDEGYFCSNRASSKGIDNIYSFSLPEQVFMIEGTLRDQTGQPIPKAFVRIIGSNGTNVKLRTNDEGVYGQTLDRDVDYILLYGAQGFENQKVTLSTYDKKRSEIFTIDISLRNAPK